MKKLITWIKNNLIILVLMGIALLLRIAVIKELGFNYSLKSDDLSYIKSGIVFLETGTITMHGFVSAQIMPGMTFLIAFFALFFGGGYALIVALKTFWIIMGLICIYGIYKTVNLYAPKIYGCIAAVFLLTIDFAWLDNIIITETPFMLAFIYLVYNSLALAKTKKKTHFWFIITWYIIGIAFRPVIGLYPLFLIAYLLWCKYDIKLLVKQLGIAAIIVACFIVPWTIRNYIVFDRFIPLTYGTGNPLLLGTYQGYNFPSDESLDYKKNVDDTLSDEMKAYMFEGYREKRHLLKYYWLEYDGIKAKYRMKEWWKRDPKSMILSYIEYKPSILMYNTYYGPEILNIPSKFNLNVRKLDIVLTCIAILAILLNRKRIKELVFLLSIYIFQIAVYSYTYAFSRYGQTLYFFRFIIIGLGLYVLFEYMKKIKDSKL